MSKIMGQRIREKREAAGWTVEELADKIGVARQTVYKWEKGQVKNIDRGHVFYKNIALFYVTVVIYVQLLCNSQINAKRRI